MKKPELSDGVITLRAYKKQDIPIVYEAVRESIATIKPWMGWCDENYSLKDTEGFILSRDSDWDKGRAYDFGIFRCSDGLFLGGCGLNKIGNALNQLNLGYWVRQTEMGKGYVPRAVRLATRWAFANIKIYRLEISAGVGNKASQRVAQKVGAKREACLRKYVDVRGDAMDCYVCSIIPADLPAIFPENGGEDKAFIF